ncbi:MAG TPA: GGDEF domain-containing protein [Burkholderiaceae bacterium]|nr:GGDEF domain-containing protein [Burkholderiaceae bacterium]
MSPETAFALGALMVLANGGVLGLMHSDILPALQPSAKTWRISSLLIAGSALTLLTLGQLPDGFVLPVANGLTLLGFTGYWRSLRQFDGLPDRWWMLLPFGLGLGVVLWFTLVQPVIGVRVVAITLCWLFLFAACCLTLLNARHEQAISRRVLAAIFGVAAAFVAVRGVVFVALGGQTIPTVMTDTSWVNLATPMLLGVLPVVGTTAFLLMCSERVRRQWEHAASTDHLTGLANRRTLAQAGEQRFRRAQQGTMALAVAVADIDHFKAINDTHGHDVGDQALKHVASALAGACRATELPGRQGGEEFLVVLDVQTPAEALAAGERLRQAVAATPYQGEGLRLPITVSIGVALLNASDRSFDRLVMRADSALYAAKAGGRNRVELAEEPAATPAPATDAGAASPG